MLKLELTSNAQDILRQVDGLPSRMGRHIAAAMDLENQLTIGHAQQTYLTGPRPQKLGVVSNRLRSSLNASKATVAGDTIASIIGTNVIYAGVHEHGIDKKVQVDAHTRSRYKHGKLGTGSQTLLTFDMKTGRIKKGRTIKRTQTGEVQVKAHARQMKMPARPFLAPSLADRAPNYSAAISLAIEAAWKEGTS